MPKALASKKTPQAKTRDLASVNAVIVENRILTIRGLNVMMDSDLADLYQVETSHLNRAVKRNPKRFPADFMFRLNQREWASLRCQLGISNVTSARGGRRFAPYVFTEQGVSMLSSVLDGDRAAAVNVAIMRAFSRMRKMAATNKDLLRKIEEMEAKYDNQFRSVFHAIKQLVDVPSFAPPKRKIGFPTASRSLPAAS
jgi:hypothetical protein